jgi:hypothetical protein
MKIVFLLVLLLLTIPSISSLKLPNNSKSKVTEVTVIPPNYNVPIGALSLSALSLSTGNLFAAVPFGAIGALLTVQAGRVRFLFDNEALEIKVEKGEDKLTDSRENFVVGGKNRWSYKNFTEWYFIPSKDFPVLMYFKETQTSPGGQSHLFPVIMNGKKLYEAMMKNVGPK